MHFSPIICLFHQSDLSSFTHEPPYDKEKNIFWTGTYNGLYQYIIESNEFVQITLDDTHNPLPAQLKVNSIVKDQDAVIWAGANNIFCDPLLEGDCTHLCWGSNCANAGEDALFYDHVWYHCVTYDIDGEQRPYAGTQPDIGVDETEVVFQEMPGDDEREEIINVFPAPVRSKATVAFELAENTLVVINIYSANGALAKTVYSSTLPEGIHRVAWNAGNLSPGVYFLKADLGKQSYTKKIVIVK